MLPPYLPPTILATLVPFAPLFSRRVWAHVQVLVAGALLAPSAAGGRSGQHLCHPPLAGPLPPPDRADHVHYPAATGRGPVRASPSAGPAPDRATAAERRPPAGPGHRGGESSDRLDATDRRA